MNLLAPVRLNEKWDDLTVQRIGSDAVDDGRLVDVAVRRLARQQLPQHNAVRPHIYLRVPVNHRNQIERAIILTVHKIP